MEVKLIINRMLTRASYNNGGFIKIPENTPIEVKDITGVVVSVEDFKELNSSKIKSFTFDTKEEMPSKKTFTKKGNTFKVE